MDESQLTQLRASMYRELAQYVEPKRKAVEVIGEDDGSVQYGALLVPGMSDREEWIEETRQQQAQMLSSDG
jgi:hypothetical protein